MRKSLVVLFVMVLAALGAHMLKNEVGSVTIVYGGTEIATSVPGFLMLLLIAYVLIRVGVHLLRAPREFGEAVGRQKILRSKRKTTQGLIEMAEGNWARSEKILAQGAKSSDTPLINYLNAARAAQLQGAHERRDNWLMLAYEQDEDAADAVLLTQAQLQIDHQQYEEALATLRKLNDGTPEHAQGMALLASIYKQLGDWQSLRDMLPKLAKKKALAADELVALSEQTYAALVHDCGILGDSEALTQLWNSIPKKDRQRPAILHAYIEALRDSSQADAAEKTLRAALNANWDKQLVLDYGTLVTQHTAKQFSFAENWLKSHANDAALLLTAARLAMRSELWGKARSYLESSLALDPRVDAYQLYGQLLEVMGESEGASNAFRKGLTLATGINAELPKLDAPSDDV